MKQQISRQRQQGLTILEVIIVIFVVAVLVGLLLPALARTKVRPSRINCVSNIKQIGLAARIWSNDNNDKFPWTVSTSTNGTLEFAESPEVFRHFLALSNELNSPKVLVCPADSKRSKVTDFAQLNNQHLSYFVGLDADEAQPQSILSGDRNITGGLVASNGIMRLNANSPAVWGTDLHNGQGNIGLGDGSAQQVTPNSLRKQIQSALLAQTNLPALRLAIPK